MRGFGHSSARVPQPPRRDGDRELFDRAAEANRETLADVYDETGASFCACAARSLSQILTMAAMSSSSSGSMK
jgi:hypothetical protein